MAKGKKRLASRTGITAHLKHLRGGDTVTLVFNPSIPFHLPKRIIGCTGTIIGGAGSSYIVGIKEGKKPKKFIVKAAHLKKLKSITLKNDKKI